jgi:hypothetical protein
VSFTLTEGLIQPNLDFGHKGRGRPWESLSAYLRPLGPRRWVHRLRGTCGDAGASHKLRQPLGIGWPRRPPFKSAAPAVRGESSGHLNLDHEVADRHEAVTLDHAAEADHGRDGPPDHLPRVGVVREHGP